MFSLVEDLILLLFLLSILGYFLIILREKFYMNKNIIIIRNKNLTKDDLKEIDINEFSLKGKRVKAGDEVKITTSSKEKLNGTIIGGNKSNKSVHIITIKNKIRRIKVNKIIKFKIISKYGKFLNC